MSAMNTTYQYDQDFLDWQKQIQQELEQELIEEARLNNISIELFGVPTDMLDIIFDNDQDIINSAMVKIQAKYNKKYNN